MIHAPARVYRHFDVRSPGREPNGARDEAADPAGAGSSVGSDDAVAIGVSVGAGLGAGVLAELTGGPADVSLPDDAVADDGGDVASGAVWLGPAGVVSAGSSEVVDIAEHVTGVQARPARTTTLLDR